VHGTCLGLFLLMGFIIINVEPPGYTNVDLVSWLVGWLVS
jgi:hypothetical protein